jgi:hypothetical protein
VYFYLAIFFKGLNSNSGNSSSSNSSNSSYSTAGPCTSAAIESQSESRSESDNSSDEPGPVASASELFARIEHAARDEVLQAGGSLSHHHGVGKIRAPFLPRVAAPATVSAKHGVLLFVVFKLFPRCVGLRPLCS